MSFFKNILNQLNQKKVVPVENKILLVEDLTEKKAEIEVPHQYNYQLNNEAYNNLLPSAQCGYTTDAVILSEDIPAARNDEFISDIILTFEKNYLAGKASRFGITMANHVKIIQYYLDKYKIKKRVKFIPHSGTFLDISYALMHEGSAVMLAGMMTKHGHFMPCVGYSDYRKALKIHDPYKKFDFKTGKYTNLSGADSWYGWDEFLPYLEKSSYIASDKKFKGIRMLYLEKI